ncbi:YesL family protein [Lederbergia citrea]|uniref:DUF624 domain-containing protein n=1 Tax=Lederbergia citrea TaxID=2833581 RepID=A0A942UKA6_9BACI|nr:DUF624 domain-containing protein [Lederbergia citrea]MBS4178466.1 DUF624 domain-containing protein [Lederbergia citrea]MBS4223000.1 DUF624 domain-containing protein [Lederbergia citrea]
MNIFSIDSGFYRFLEKFTNFFLLNLLWFLMCIPIITIFPATAAMFGVVRQWVQKKDSGVFKSFFVYFKENFKQSFLLGLLWFVFALLFYFNINISLQMSGIAKIIMVSSLLFICLFFVMTTIYLFPVMVHYKMRWTLIIKNSFLFSISQLWVTIRCILILLLTVLISYVIPISSIILWSIGGYLIYALCDKSFKKIELLVQDNV